MFEPAETAIVEELQDHREESNTFTHHTYSALNADGIQECLEENDVERLYLCGIDTDAAVLDTAFHAFNTGMDVAVIQNLCGSTGGKELHRSALNIMERTIGNLVHSGELK